ncbi:unnamed protein product [Gemmataceae bacterium]|nr:unnamed protein product [Gemmataceae bacterium]VTT98925.1 unnamed protein product [Gemmataceae bacterium]
MDAATQKSIRRNNDRRVKNLRNDIRSRSASSPAAARSSGT